MKKSFLAATFLILSLVVYAQYTQVLPLNYEDFFRADAIAEDGNALERGEYETTTDAINANQWNRTGKDSEKVESSPVVRDNTLSYGSYIDNGKGKEILLANLPLNGTSIQVRSSIYSLQSKSVYTNAEYYLAALINISQATGKGDILAFDGNHTANAQRARLYVNKSGSGFCVGLGWNGDPTIWSSELAFGTTHLVVVKIKPLQAGNTAENLETATLFLDPDITKSEAANTALAVVDGTADISGGKGLKSIRGITVRQRSKLAGSIAGLRLGTSWEDVIQTDEIVTQEKIITDFTDGTWGDISASAYASGAYPTSSINGFILNAAGMQTGSITYSATGARFSNRISVDKSNNNGMVTLPAVSDISHIVVYASPGDNDRVIELQILDYGTNQWGKLADYTCEEKGICYRFSTVINHTEPTCLRLVNKASGPIYIWKIETYPIVSLANVVTDFANTEIWGSPDATSYSSGGFPTSEIDNINLVKAGLVKKSIYYELTGEYLSPRLEVDKKSNGGMVVLPAVSSVAQVDVYASVGGEYPTFTLDSFCYNNDTWVTIETFTCAEKNICYRFSKILNRTDPTKLRIANADGSVKYIWKIVTYSELPADLAVPMAQSATNVSSHAFTARWTAVSGATGYRIAVYKSDDTHKTTKIVEGDITQFNITNLDASTSYYYKVSAIGDGITTVDSYLSEAVDVTTTADAAIAEYYTRSVTAGNYGTICLPRACEDLLSSGGVFFAVAGKVLEAGKLKEVVFEEVTTLEAGRPYVFLASTSEINVPMTGDAVGTAGSHNGLIGSFEVKKVSKSEYNYVLSNNLLYCAKNTQYYVGENRAYFKIDEIRYS